MALIPSHHRVRRCTITYFCNTSAMYRIQDMVFETHRNRILQTSHEEPIENPFASYEGSGVTQLQHGAKQWTISWGDSASNSNDKPEHRGSSNLVRTAPWLRARFILLGLQRGPRNQDPKSWHHIITRTAAGSSHHVGTVAQRQDLWSQVMSLAVVGRLPLAPLARKRSWRSHLSLVPGPTILKSEIDHEVRHPHS